MGYFSNGSEGMIYQEHYCSRCIHDNEGKEIYCPIWNLHLSYNYKEANNNDSFLHALIPLDEKGGNKQCAMFVDRGALTNLQIERIEHEQLESLCGR